MTRALRAAAFGAAAGIGLFLVSALAFAKGCPIFDWVLESETIHPF